MADTDGSHAVEDPKTSTSDEPKDEAIDEGTTGPSPKSDVEGSINGTGGPTTPLGDPPESADLANIDTDSADKDQQDSLQEISENTEMTEPPEDRGQIVDVRSVAEGDTEAMPNETEATPSETKAVEDVSAVAGETEMAEDVTESARVETEATSEMEALETEAAAVETEAIRDETEAVEDETEAVEDETEATGDVEDDDEVLQIEIPAKTVSQDVYADMGSKDNSQDVTEDSRERENSPEQQQEVEDVTEVAGPKTPLEPESIQSNEAESAEPIEQETPVEREDAPIEAKDTSVKANGSPVEAIDTPVEAEDAPVEAENSPIEAEDSSEVKSSGHDIAEEESGQGKMTEVSEEKEEESMDVDEVVEKTDAAVDKAVSADDDDDVEMVEKETENIDKDVEMVDGNSQSGDKTDETEKSPEVEPELEKQADDISNQSSETNKENDQEQSITEKPSEEPEKAAEEVSSTNTDTADAKIQETDAAEVSSTVTTATETPSYAAEASKEETAVKMKEEKKSAEDDDDDVVVIEEDKQEPEAIILDDDDDDEPTTKPKPLATMDSSNDTGLQISSVTSGADAGGTGLQIASVSGAGTKASTNVIEPLKTKIKQEKTTPPSTPTVTGPTTRKSTPGSNTPKKSTKMQSCIVCSKVGRCKYNIVRNGDIKHLCDDVCFRKFRANPTMFLKNTPAQPKQSQQKAAQASTRSQSGTNKPAQKKNSTSDYKSCTVCQLMNINTQKPFIIWMGTDFCSESCLSKYQGNLNSSCTYCNSYIPITARPANCLQVGTEFKTFCSPNCNSEYKKRIKLCLFCHKDMTKMRAALNDKFCSKVCMMKYEEKTSDVEIVGVESTGKKALSYKCAVCSKAVPSKHNIKLNGVMNRLCSDPCLSAFQYANKLAMNTCDNCGGLCPTEEIVSHFIQFEGQQKRFCKDSCVNAFRNKHRKIVPCAWCASRKTNFDMIERVDSNNKYQLFCSLNCLSLYRVNLQAKSNQAVSCDHCRKFVPAQYHLTMSDASVRNFCSYNCVMAFQSQFSANSKNPSQPTIHSQQRVQLQTKPNTRTANSNTQSQSQPNSFPVISNVVSLAPQGQKQQTVNIKSSTPVQVVTGGQGGKQSVSTGTQQQIIIQPPPPKQMKNKSLLCKPFVQTKATSCRPHTRTKEVQTDEQEGKPVLIPIPIPIYIPCPLAMYAQPTPHPVPFPIPIPVPVFIPTHKKSADKILKHIKEIQEKIPSDPLEAELLMMAEAVASGHPDSDSDSDKDAAEPFDPAPVENDKPNESTDIEPEIERAPPGGEEDLVQMALRMAEEITGPVLDLETSVEPVAVNMEPPAAPTPPPAPKPVVEEEDDEYIPPRETRARRGKRGSRGRGGRAKRARIEIPEPEPVPEPSPPPVVANQPPPDANMNLKYTYGVNAWRHWVVHKNTLLEKVSKRGSGKLKLFKTDLLQCTADELNYSLCLFVKEVRKPNGEEYSPDSIFYLTLGIQQYLYENSRIDNIFTDLYYEKFTECLNDVLGKYEPKVNATGQMLCRIEEEHIWECKQLGAHSPYVLLNTLIYFNTKHFMLKTSEEHMKLSFAHILKHWKKGGPSGGKVQTGQGRSVSLRYYCMTNGQGGPTKKAKEGLTPVYETSENLENPLRCPVKLYEFYLSKCPESIKNRNDMFYLVPERSCVPDSPVWYSTQSIGTDSMSKMLNRILLCREIQEAHIHASPVYV